MKKLFLLLLPFLIASCGANIFPLNEFDINYAEKTERYFKNADTDELCLYVSGVMNNGHARNQTSMNIINKEFYSRNVDRSACNVVANKYLEDKKLEKLEQEDKKVRLAELNRQQIAKAQQDRLIAFIEGKKSICKAYGFTEENAIASCVQTEINNEINRLQAQQVYANAQARANAIQRNNALSNMGRCLSTEGNFAACGNAWNGYTPKPAKKVYKCDYDVFGNQISSTCREQ